MTNHEPETDTLALQHAIVEVVPIERFGTSSMLMVDSISKALPEVGYNMPCPLRRNRAIVFAKLQNHEMLRTLAETAFGSNSDEYVWLVTQHFDSIFLVRSSSDLLFGLASTNAPNSLESPYSRSAAYVAGEVGGPLSATSLSRLICSAALKKIGMTELAEKTDVYWSLPIESALQASIELVPESTSLDLNLRGIHDMDSDVEIRPIDIISSKMLVSQRIIELLQDESLLEQVPIAKGMPFQLFSTSDQPGAASAFSLFNHFWIKARCGTLFDLSEELLGIAVDLNWSHSRRPGTKLSHDQKQAYAIAQIARLKHLEERESAIRHSLEVLQKRFPHRSELVLWEINNQFANVIQYSPTYTRWKHHLQEALHGDEPPGHWLAGLIAQVDWQQLESCGLADTSEAKQLIQLINVDPNSMLAKMRVLLEKMIRYMFDNRFPGESTALVGMLQRLNDVKMFPSIVYAGLNYLRIILICIQDGTMI